MFKENFLANNLEVYKIQGEDNKGRMTLSVLKKLKYYQIFQFSDTQFNLTSPGLNLIS